MAGENSTSGLTKELIRQNRSIYQNKQKHHNSNKKVLTTRDPYKFQTTTQYKNDKHWPIMKLPPLENKTTITILFVQANKSSLDPFIIITRFLLLLF